MSTAAGPSVNRGDITLQPSYFTSSLFVEPLREDIADLVNIFAQRYVETWPPVQPFALFKRLWSEQGWRWLHFKVLNARARETFINVTERLFVERLADAEPSLVRVIALFALYTFHLTQPATQNPPIHSVKHIAIPLGAPGAARMIRSRLTSPDIYQALRLLPLNLTNAELLPLQPYATYVLKTLEDAKSFHILPRAELRPYKPSALSREMFVTEERESAIIAALTGTTSGANGGALKKKGRPSRRDKQKKAKDALAALEKYLEKNTTALAATPAPMLGYTATATDCAQTTHRMVVHPPSATREQYRNHKAEVLGMLNPSGAEQMATEEPTRAVHADREALQRANEAVLARLKMIDEMAAEQGLEVGGEGGEKTGLARVERAVQQLLASGDPAVSVGILGLLEGAGLDASWEM